jgi:hypothetical protein
MERLLKRGFVFESVAENIVGSFFQRVVLTFLRRADPVRMVSNGWS